MKLHCSILLIAALLASFGVRAGEIMDDFFPEKQGNLTRITWAHAVNNQSYLTATLEDARIDMIEADIVLGVLYANLTAPPQPVMGHPPANTSDLSLESFLQQVSDFNGKNATKKGVKLDFKTTDVFVKSVDIVKKFDKNTFPIWLNADILDGPVNATTSPVDASVFLTNAKTFAGSVLSIGWTTKYGANVTGIYEPEQIDAMVEAIRSNNVTQQPITFPVRAGLAAESRQSLEDLLKKIDNSTLTIWSSRDDNVDIDHLRWLIKEVGVANTYVDVPEELLEQLHLDDLPTGGGGGAALATGMIMFLLGALVVIGA